MHDFPDEAVPWASDAAAAPPDEDVLEIGAWAAAIRPPVHFHDKAAPARNAPTLVTNLLRYGPYAALTACLFGGAWLAWSHLDRPARTVIQPEGFVRATAGRLRWAQRAQTQAAIRPRGRSTRPTRRSAFVCKPGG